MSEGSESAAPLDAEIVEGVAVLEEDVHPEPRSVFPPASRRSAVIPSVQSAAVAAGGFVAGAALIGLVHRSRRPAALGHGARAGRRLAKGSRSQREVPALMQVVSTRSLLVHIHTLGPVAPDR